MDTIFRISGLRAQESWWDKVEIPPGIPRDIQDLIRIIGVFITVAYSFAGVAAVAYIIFAGYTIMTASGDPQKLKKGQDTLTYAIAGLVLVVCSGLIVEFVARLLGVENIILFFAWA